MMKKIFVILLVLVLFTGCASQDPSVPDKMQLASRADVAYCLYVPKTWNVNLDSGVSSAFYSSDDPANISVMSYMPEGESMSIDDYWKFSEETYQTSFDNYTFVSSETTLLGGRKAGKYIFTATVGGVESKLMQIIAAYNQMFYVFTYTASPETFDSHLEEVQNIADHFVFR